MVSLAAASGELPVIQDDDKRPVVVGQMPRPVCLAHGLRGLERIPPGPSRLNPTRVGDGQAGTPWPSVGSDDFGHLGGSD